MRDLEHAARRLGGLATDVARYSVWHGPGHWRDVARLGRIIALNEEGVDPTVVFLFAAAHDTQRWNEHRDPEHGARAADLVRDMVGLPLDEEQRWMLDYALRWHDRKSVTRHPTIGACWDADRLTLPRVNISVDPIFLNTYGGRWLAAVGTGERVVFGEDLPWSEIVTTYDHVIKSNAAS